MKPIKNDFRLVWPPRRSDKAVKDDVFAKTVLPDQRHPDPIAAPRAHRRSPGWRGCSSSATAASSASRPRHVRFRAEDPAVLLVAGNIRELENLIERLV